MGCKDNLIRGKYAICKQSPGWWTILFVIVAASTFVLLMFGAAMVNDYECINGYDNPEYYNTVINDGEAYRQAYFDAAMENSDRGIIGYTLLITALVNSCCFLPYMFVTNYFYNKDDYDDTKRGVVNFNWAKPAEGWEVKLDYWTHACGSIVMAILLALAFLFAGLSVVRVGEQSCMLAFHIIGGVFCTASLGIVICSGCISCDRVKGDKQQLLSLLEKFGRDFTSNGEEINVSDDVGNNYLNLKWKKDIIEQKLIVKRNAMEEGRTKGWTDRQIKKKYEIEKRAIFKIFLDKRKQ